MVAEAAAAWIERVGEVLAAPRINAAARARVLARYDWAARLAPLDALLGLGGSIRAAA